MSRPRTTGKKSAGKTGDGKHRDRPSAGSVRFFLLAIGITALGFCVLWATRMTLSAPALPPAESRTSGTEASRPPVDGSTLVPPPLPGPSGALDLGEGEILATATRLAGGAGIPDRNREGRGRIQAPTRRGTLVLIIDDAGYSLSELEPFLALPFPLTVAVLPGLADSAETGRRVLAAGKELILHQPMQALGGQDPGPAAVTLELPPSEVTRIVAANLDALPGAVGLNNHMGSAVTRVGALMTPILELAKARGIYYVDSLTVPDSAVKSVAAGENLRYWERSVFLDNSPDRASILRSLDEAKKKAETGTPAVMIGHIWSTELATTLQELYPLLVEEGFSLSTISRLMIEEANARSRH